MTDKKPTHADISAICKDAFYDARDNGGTMTTAADNAASQIIRLIEQHFLQAANEDAASAVDVGDLIEAMENADPSTCGACKETFKNGHSCSAILRGWEDGFNTGYSNALYSAARDAISSPATRAGDLHRGDTWADWLKARAKRGPQ